MRDLDLRGIIAATVTPMTEDLAIDVDALRAYMQHLLAEGVHGVAVNVDTGEGPVLDSAERLTVVETVRDVVGDRIPVISGLAPQWIGTFLVLCTPMFLMQAFQLATGDLEPLHRLRTPLRALVYLFFIINLVLLGEDFGEDFLYFQF